MITALKAESENKEVHDKSRARSAMITEPVEGTMELRTQIARLMATLTRAGQGNSPTSAPNKPREVMGKDRWTGTLLVTPAPTMVKLAWDRLPCLTVCLPGTVQGQKIKARDRMPKGPKIARKALQIGRSQFPPVLQVPRLGPHGSRMCHTSQDFKPVQEELRECSPNSHCQQPQQPTVGPQHSFPDPEQKLTILNVA